MEHSLPIKSVTILKMSQFKRIRALFYLNEVVDAVNIIHGLHKKNLCLNRSLKIILTESEKIKNMIVKTN